MAVWELCIPLCTPQDDAPMPEGRRFPPPWTVRHNDDAYWVEDAAGNRFGFTYFRDRPLVGTNSQAYLSRDEARRIVTNFAKLPELLSGK